jgi:hypothetical protein
MIFYSDRNRTGLIPTVNAQAANILSQGGIAYRIARSQARKGVHPDLATKHAINVSWNIRLYATFVLLPTLAFMCFGWNKPMWFIWCKLIISVTGIMLGFRLWRSIVVPASKRILYFLPTWTLVVAGTTAVAVVVLRTYAEYSATFGDVLPPP